jgi:hypothetical protein
MARAIPTVCACCDAIFFASHNATRYCSINCKQTASYRRRKRRDTQLLTAAPQLMQAQVLDDPDELPASWARAAEALPPLMTSCSWKGTSIERRQSDGYVNATAMCQANGRHWFKFHQSVQCQDYITALSDVSCIPVTDLIDSRRGGLTAGGATWIHPDLATELARWISPAFSVFVNRWFRSEMERKAKRPEPQLPQLPPTGPAVLIRAKDDHEARMIWLDTIWRSLASDKHPDYQRI